MSFFVCQCIKVFPIMSRARGGGGTQQFFLRGGSAPRSNPLPFYPGLLYTIFDENGTPFVYLLLTNGTPFTYLCLELCIPFKCCKCTIF